jgi:hypothetical protein
MYVIADRHGKPALKQHRREPRTATHRRSRKGEWIEKAEDEKSLQVRERSLEYRSGRIYMAYTYRDSMNGVNSRPCVGMQ